MFCKKHSPLLYILQSVQGQADGAVHEQRGADQKWKGTEQSMSPCI